MLTYMNEMKFCQLFANLSDMIPTPLILMLQVSKFIMTVKFIVKILCLSVVVVSFNVSAGPSLSYTDLRCTGEEADLSECHYFSISHDNYCYEGYNITCPTCKELISEQMRLSKQAFSLRRSRFRMYLQHKYTFVPFSGEKICTGLLLYSL